MADLKKTVELIFDGVDKTGGAIRSVGSGLNSLVDKTGNVTGVMASVTESIVKLDVALAAAGVGITAFAVKLSDDFDTAFAEIATIIGQPADNLRDFQSQILEYSEVSTASLEEITNATYGAISAGVDYQDSLELIAAAEQLAIAGKADLGSTTTALVSVMNAFGAEASEAGAYADTFFTAVQLGQTTIPELSEAIGRLAPVAAAAGLDFKEMAAAIATITAETGTSTREAITGIRAAINAILKPTKEAADLASDLGIEFNAAALESKGFAGILQEVKEASGGNTEVLARLFGSIESLPAVLSLTGNAADAFADNLKAFEDNAGAAASAADQLRDDLSRIAQTLKNNVESALIGFGGRLTDETQSIVRSVTSIFNSLGDEIRLEDGVFEPILSGLDGLAQDIDQKLQTIAANMPEALKGLDLSELLSAFGGLGDELDEVFKDLFGDVDLSTVEGLAQAMQRTVDAFTALVNISAGIADGLEPLFEAVGAGIEQFESLDESTKKNIGELLGLGTAVDKVLPLVSGLAGGLESVGTGLTALAGAQGFKALIGNLNSIKAIGSTAGKGGLIGAALGVGYWAGGYINEWIEQEFGSIGAKLYEVLNSDEIKQLQQQFGPLTGELKNISDETAELRRLNDRLTESLDNSGDSAELNIDALNRRAAELVNNANEQARLADAVGDFSGNQRDAANAVERLNQQVSASGGALGEVSDATRELAENNSSLVLGYDEATGKVNSFSGTIVGAGKAMDDTAEKTDKAAKRTEEFLLGMEKIASDERIANIEASVSLDIAEVEAGAEKVKALAESISETFSDSTNLVGDLWGIYENASLSDKFSLQQQIKNENKNREEILEQQRMLTEAQINEIRERTKALSNGEGLFRIELDDSVSPALELVLREILDKTRIWAAEAADNFLLGTGG